MYFIHCWGISYLFYETILTSDDMHLFILLLFIIITIIYLFIFIIIFIFSIITLYIYSLLRSRRNMIVLRSKVHSFKLGWGW